MDQKIEKATSQVKKSLEKNLNKEFLLKKINDETCILYSQNSEENAIIGFPNMKEDLINIYKEYSSKTSLVVLIAEYDEKTSKYFAENETPILYAYDLEHSSYTGFIVNYFLISNIGLPCFNEVQEKVLEHCMENPEHYGHKASSFIAKYRNYNYALKRWTDDEIKKSSWEIQIFNSVLKTAKGGYGNKSFEGQTFAPLSTYKLKDGTEVHNPDLEKLKQEDGLDDYVFSRYQNVEFVLFKRRYLEFLLFSNSKRVKRPEVFNNLLLLLEKEIQYLRNNKDKISHTDLHISELMKRYIEVINNYYSSFSTEYLEERERYIKDYIDTLEKNKCYRWIIDIPRFLELYPKVLKLLENEIDRIIDLLFQGETFFNDQKNSSLQEGCLEGIATLKKIKKEDFDLNTHLAEVKYQHALQMVAQGSYLGGVSLLESAINLLKSSDGKKERIKEFSELHRKWAKIAPTEMKRIETKIEIPYSEIEEERNQYISLIADIKNVEDRIGYFFRDANVLITEEAFQKLLESTKQGIAAHIPRTVLGEIGTVKRPLSDEDQDEMYEFQWYGTIIAPYLDKIIYLFSNFLDKNIFSLDDIINSIEKNEAIQKDDKLFLKEGIELFRIERFAASSYILFHLIERFFRLISAEVNQDIKYKSRGVEFNVSLDDLIKDSAEHSFPKSLVRFFRYFFSRVDGINLRNTMAHSLTDYNFLNSKGIALVMLWSTLICYNNLVVKNDTD